MSGKVRERFEAHAISRGDGDRLAAERGVYLDHGISLSWHYWQASRAAALEEAARVGEGSVSIDENDEDWNDACDGCADAIRALAGRGA